MELDAVHNAQHREKVQRRPQRLVAAPHTIKNLGIERLRGAAIFLTFLVHLNFDAIYSSAPMIFRETWGGVFLFFVISGFLVSSSLFKSLPKFNTDSWTERWTQSRVPVTAFFLRRYYRIVPAALAVMGVLLAASLSYSLLKQDSKYFLDHLYEELAIVGGFYNYAIGAGLTRYFGHFWSLTVEEHFYVALPFLALLFPTGRGRLKMAVVGILAVSVVLRPLAILFRATVYPDLFTRVPTHLTIDFLFAGVALYLLREKGFAKTPFVGKRTLHMLGGVALFVLAVIPAILPWEHTKAQTTVATFFSLLVAATFLVYLGSLKELDLFRFPVITPVLEWMGARCYSLYLVHFPILMYSDRLIVRNLSATQIHASQALLLIAQLAMVCFVGEVLYRSIEVPFNRKGRRRSEELLTARLDS